MFYLLNNKEQLFFFAGGYHDIVLYIYITLFEPVSSSLMMLMAAEVAPQGSPKSKFAGPEAPPGVVAAM